MTVDLAQETDEFILSRYRDEGSPGDFETIVRRHESSLVRYLRRYLGDAALADDVWQNAILQVFRKASFYQDGRPVRPWIYAIATHQAVDALRKRGRHPTVSLDRPSVAGDDGGGWHDTLAGNGPTPVADLEDRERREQLARCIARLPETLRSTLILAYIDRRKYREIAEIQSIPVGTVKSRLHAALLKLQGMFRVAEPAAFLTGS